MRYNSLLSMLLLRQGMETGDIVFVIKEKPHGRFTRKGDDLIHKRPVTLTQALCGVKFEIEALDGSKVTVDCTNEVIRPGMQKIFTGKGMPNSKTHNVGALVVEFDVIFPTKPLSEEQKRLVRQADLDKNL
jgi:DnaJ-class molecular chaperone